VAERFEKRIVDEILKMFNDSDSFYFSLTGDITNSVQRLNTSSGGKKDIFLFYQKEHIKA